MPASAVTPSGSTSSTSRISCATSVSRRLAASWRSSERATFLARGAHALRARRVPPCRHRPALFRRSRARRPPLRRAVSAASISPISARRFSANACGASSRLRALGRAFRRCAFRASRSARCALPRSRPGSALGGVQRASRRSACSASRASACASARTSACWRAFAARRLSRTSASSAFKLGSRARSAASCAPPRRRRGLRFGQAASRPGLGFGQRGAAGGDAVDLALRRRHGARGRRPRRAAGSRHALRACGFGLRGRCRSASAASAASNALRSTSSAVRAAATRLRRRQGGCVRRGAARRRSAHWRRPQSRPSARGRLRARQGAGRASAAWRAAGRRLPRDQADLRQPARQFGGALTCVASGIAPSGRRGSPSARCAGPMHRRGRCRSALRDRRRARRRAPSRSLSRP